MDSLITLIDRCCLLVVHWPLFILAPNASQATKSVQESILCDRSWMADNRGFLLQNWFVGHHSRVYPTLDGEIWVKIDIID